jgi:hypothetical protein
MITSWKTPALLIETLVPLHIPNAKAVPSMSPKLCMHIYTVLPTAWKTTGRRRTIIIQSANPLFDIDIRTKKTGLPSSLQAPPINRQRTRAPNGRTRTTTKPRTINKKDRKIRGNENGRARRLASGGGGGGGGFSCQ